MTVNVNSKVGNCKIWNSPLFDGCSIDQIEEIRNVQFCSHFSREDYILREGETASSVFCLCWGKVKITKKISDKCERIISLAKPGDVLGLRSVLSEPNHSNSAIALEDSAGYFIDKKDLFRLIQKHRSIYMNSTRLLFEQIDYIEQKIDAILQNSVSQRVATVLLILKETYGLCDGNFLNVMISREDLANLANTTRVTIYRTLNDFRRKGIIDIKNKHIQILNLKELQQHSK